jgi:CPA2 family monovalent cation:H+ antiporter-2
MDHERLATITIPLGAHCVGLSLEQLALKDIGVRLVHRRKKNGQINDDPQGLLDDGDTLVLSGRPQALAVAEEKLLHA